MTQFAIMLLNDLYFPSVNHVIRPAHLGHYHYDIVACRDVASDAKKSGIDF